MSSSSTLDYIYGPISQDYCVYFYVLSVLGFVALLIVLLAMVFYGLSSKKNSITFYLNLLMLAGLYGLGYFQNRLLYNMCAGGIKKNEQV